MSKPDWHIIWMTWAFTIAQRSIDPSTKHGCVFVNDDNIFLSTGYNSFPKDCMDDKLPLTRPEKYSAIIHSEINSIVNSINSLKGSTAYITGHPCPYCFGNMLQAGIKKIIYGPIGSHCIDSKDIELINMMNWSEKTGRKKIRIIKFEDICEVEKIFELQKTIENYIKDKMKLTHLTNG